MAEPDDPTFPTPENLPTDPSASLRPPSSLGELEASNPQLRPTVLFGANLGNQAFETQRDPSAYMLRREMGHGAFGEVWEAVQVALGRVVAVKRPRAPGEGSTEEERVRQSRINELLFHKEALTTAHLDHPNIVPVYDLGCDAEGRPLLAMKLVEGTAWDRMLEADVKMPMAELLARHLPILLSVTRAVAFAHSRGIVHRDLKPSQVVVGNYGETFLMDWGLAVAMPDAPAYSGFEPARSATPRDQAPNPAGTVAYMAPEQTDSTAERVGPWTDVFLLGGMLYEMLAGRAPHPQKSSVEAFHHAASGRVEPPDTVAPERGIPEELLLLCRRAMEREPEARMQSAREFAQAIEAYLSGAGRRTESRRLTEEARSVLGEASDSYDTLAKADSLLIQALDLWSDSPDALALHDRVMECFVRTALARGDRRLAGVQAARVGSASLGQELQQRVDAAERAARRHARQRRMALAGSLALTLVAVAIGLSMAFSRWREQVQAAEHAREMQVLAENERTEQARLQREQARAAAEAGMMQLRKRTRAFVEKAQKLLSVPHEIVPGRDWSWIILASRPAWLREMLDELEAIRRLRADLQAVHMPVENESYDFLMTEGTLALGVNTTSSLQRGYESFARAAEMGSYRYEPFLAMAVAASRLEQLTSATHAAEKAVAIVSTGESRGYQAVQELRAVLAHLRCANVDLAPGDLVIEAWKTGRNHDRFRIVSGTWRESESSSLHKSTAPGLTPQIRCSSVQYHFYEPFLALRVASPAVARFVPDFTTPQRRHVYVSWPAEANATPVYYRVRHGGGETTVALTQNGLGIEAPSNANSWVKLGEFEFRPGDDQFVEVSAGDDARPFTPQRYGQAVADSVLFAVRPLTVGVLEPDRAVLPPGVAGPVADEPATTATAIAWTEKLDDALQLAQSEQRLLLVFSAYPVSSYVTHPINRYRDYCENRLFASGGVGRAMKETCVALKVDLSRNPETAERFGVPNDGTSIAIADSHGTVLDRITSNSLMLSPVELAARVRTAAQKNSR